MSLSSNMFTTPKPQVMNHQNQPNNYLVGSNGSGSFNNHNKTPSSSTSANSINFHRNRMNLNIQSGLYDTPSMAFHTPHQMNQMASLQHQSASASSSTLHTHDTPVTSHRQHSVNIVNHHQSKDVTTMTEEWPVQVFRKTIGKGWENYIYYTPAPQAQSQTKNSSTSTALFASPNPGTNTMNSPPPIMTPKTPPVALQQASHGTQHTQEFIPNTIVMASPKKGCVEIKQLRLRINLFPSIVDTTSNNNNNKFSPSSTMTSPNNNNNNNKKASNGNHSNTIVIQRLDTILLSTRKGGAVVLKFSSRLDCNLFSDRLVALNLEYIPKTIPQAAAVAATEESEIAVCRSVNDITKSYLHNNNKNKQEKLNNKQKMAKQQESKDDTPNMSNKRKQPQQSQQSQLQQHPNKKQLRLVDNNNESNGTADLDNNQEDSVMLQQQNHKQQVLSYIVQLLHDESFHGFVNDIEETLKSEEDCKGIYSALGIRR